MQKIYWILYLCGVLLVSFSARAAGAAEEADPDYADDADDYNNEEDESASHPDPIITSKPLKLEVDEGSKVELPCRGEHLEHVARIWQKGDNILAAGEVTVTDDKRFSLADKLAVLVIDNVTSKDAGEYSCKPTVSSDSVVEVTHSLRVREQPRASVSDKIRVVKQGEPVSLSCMVTGYPEPSVSWERKSKKMPNGEQRTEGSEITFSSVSRHHAGVYECVANNSQGMARTAINLVIMHAPEIEIEKESVNSGKGYEAELACNVHAEPKAHVTWYKDGRPLDYSKHESIQKMSHSWILHIKDVQEADFGNYTCMANNTLGRDHKNIILTGQPSQPVLKESSLGKDHMSYNLVWVLESAIPINSYRLKFRKMGDDEWQDIEVQGEKTQENIYKVSHTLPDLSSSSDYEATLLAYNEYGWSRPARVRKFHINGEFQSLEADLEPSAKGATGTSSIVSVSTLQITLALLLTVLLPRDLRWQ